MRFQWRPLRPEEPDHELIWLAVTVCAGIAGIAWLALRLPWPSCAFRELTGFPCVTCGATRATLAFVHGDLGMAWRLNPLVFAGICAVILFNLYALGVLSTGSRRIRLSLPKHGARKIALAVGAAGLLNWVYLLRQ